MSDFQAARRQYAQRGRASSAKVDLSIIPEHAQHLSAATVRVTPPGSRPTSTVRTTNIAVAEPYRYFALVLPVAGPGTYQLRVTSGSDRGCFSVSFG